MFQRRLVVFWVVIGFLLINATWIVAANDREIIGVTFPGEVVVEGKTLHLNGVNYTKFLFFKVCATALYLEKPTKNADEVIESEQVKRLVTHYVTDKVKADQLQKGIMERFEGRNPAELVTTHKKDIETYAKWNDKDMKSGMTSVTTYVPDKGLTLNYMGEEKGTIPGKEFAQMFFRFTVGDKVEKADRDGLLGL